MSYYEPQGWQAPVRQASWEQPAPPSRSGEWHPESKVFLRLLTIGTGASSTSQREDSGAFATQFEGTISQLFRDAKSDLVQRSIEPWIILSRVVNFMPVCLGPCLWVPACATEVEAEAEATLVGLTV